MYSNPVVCGISSLGLDHIDLLGDTLEKIAWQKAGICKPGHPVFTVPQEASALSVLRDRAFELGAKPLTIATPINKYHGPPTSNYLMVTTNILLLYPTELSLSGDHQVTNASLAVQLATSWLEWKGVLKQQLLVLPQQIATALNDCYWPGRNQIVTRGHVTYYIDGAHTPQSIQVGVVFVVLYIIIFSSE